MSTNWKPGDVALVRLDDRDGEFIGLRDTHGWATNRTDRHRSHAHWTNAAYVTPVRPLVVIDPEDREQVERLYDLYASAPSDVGLRGHEFLAHALREFANPKPPKPDEPTGLGAVVEDAEGYQWVRAHGCWYRDNAWAGDADYADIAAVRVLSEGVQA